MPNFSKRLARAVAFLAMVGAGAALLAPEGEREASSPLVINEVLLWNRFAHLDADERTVPVVELVNRGAAPLDLSGYSLTNDPKAPEKWKLPSGILGSGEYRVVPLPGKRSRSLDEREILMLVGRSGRSADAVVIPRQTEDRSYARTPDGSGPFRYHLTPTPGAKNEDISSVRPIPSIPEIEPAGGFYDHPLQVSIAISLPLEDYEIRYTLDGSEPLSSSILYVGPLTLLAEPAGASRAVRAAAFHEGRRVSQIETRTYFMEKRKLTLPILAISLPPDDFERLQLDTAAHGPSSEKAVVIEELSPDGRRRMAVPAGMRLHGFTGLEGNFATKRSYRVHFRDRYGDGRLDQAWIPHGGGFHRLVLRANNDDALTQQPGATYLRDQLVRELHEEMGAIAAHGSWYNLFVNAEYRGVYNIVERIDGDFLASHVRDGSTEWDIVHDGVVHEGDFESWDRLLALLRGEDLREDAVFERVSGLMDLESFTDYMILNIWAQNHDWPHKNYFAVRPRTTSGKWTFVCWDAEVSFGLFPEGYEANTFERALSRPGGMGDLFSALFQSRRYQEFFLRRMETHLEGVLQPERVLARLRRILASTGTDMEREIEELLSREQVTLWKQNLQRMEEFIQKRPAVLRDHVYGSNRLQVATQG